MAFTSSVLLKFRVVNDPKLNGKHNVVVKGTFTNTGGSTGGDIHPGLTTVKTVHITPGANSITSNWKAPITSSASGFTLTTDADVDGWFEATGIL
jgi:hypothetical protein